MQRVFRLRRSGFNTLPKEIRQRILFFLVLSIPQKDLNKLDHAAPIKALARTLSYPLLEDLMYVMSRFPNGSQVRNQLFDDDFRHFIACDPHFREHYPLSREDFNFDCVFRLLCKHRTYQSLDKCVKTRPSLPAVRNDVEPEMDIVGILVLESWNLGFRMRMKHLAKFEAYLYGAANFKRWELAFDTSVRRLAVLLESARRVLENRLGKMEAEESPRLLQWQL